MSGWLEVAHANRYNQMYIKGFLDISGDLTVRNHNFLLKNGDAMMGGNLNVTGITTLQKMICIGDLSINGNIFANFLPNTISPDAIIGGIPSTTGIFDMDVSLNRGLFVQNNATVNGNITVGGKSLFKNDVSLNGNVYVDKLYVNGVALSNNYAQISGATFTGPVSMPSAMIQTLKLSGDISANGNVFANGLLYESGTVLSNIYAKLASPTFTGTPTAPTPDLSSANTQIATTAFVQTQLSGYVTKQSAAFLASMTTPNITVTSDASFGGSIYVSGDASMNGNVHVGKLVIVDGNVILNRGLTVQKDVSLNSNLSVSGNTSIAAQLTVQKDVSFNGRFAVASDVSLNGGLYVEGYTAINNHLDIGGSIIAQNNVNVYGIINQYSTTLANGTVQHGVDLANQAAGYGAFTNGVFDSDISGNKGLSVQNRTFLYGGLSVSGNSTFYSDISANGNVFSNNLYSNVLYEKGILIANKYAPISNAVFTGTTTIPSANMQSLNVSGDISANGNLFVGNSIYEGGTALSNKYAMLASPTFTGIPNAPTPVSSSSNTQIATTFFVKSQLAGYVTLFSPSFLGTVTAPYLFATNDTSLNTRLYVGGDASMNGNLRVGKALILNGDASMNSRLFVKGDISMNGNAYVSKTLVVVGNTMTAAITAANLITAQSGLSVTSGNTSVIGLTASSKIIAQNGLLVTSGDASFNNRLFVIGDVSMSGNAYVNNALTVTSGAIMNGGLRVTGGDASFNNRLFVLSDVSMSGNTYVNKSFAVAGSTTTASILATGPVVAQNGITISGDATMNNRLFVTSDVMAGGNVSVSNALSVANGIMVMGGDALINNRLFVVGDSSMGGNVSITNAMNVLGDTVLAGNLSVAKDLTILGRLNVQNYQENAIITTTTTNYALIVSEDLSLNGRIYTSGDASFGGNTYMAKSISVGGAAMISGVLRGSSDAFLGGNTTISGNALVSKNITVSGATTTAGLFTAQNGLVVSSGSTNVGSFTASSATISGNTNISKNITIGGTTTSTGLITAQHGLTVSSGSLTAAGNIIGQADASVAGNANVSGMFVTQGLLTAQNGMVVSGGTTMVGDIIASGSILGQTDASVAGNISIGGNASVSENLSILGVVTAQNGMTITSGDVNIGNRLFIIEDVSVGGNTTITNQLAVSGGITAQGGLVVSSGGLYISGDTSMNNNLDVSGSIVTHRNMNIYGVINQYTASLEKGLLVNSGTAGTAGILLGDASNGENTSIGISSGNKGTNNTCIGYGAGSSLTSGSNNIILGANASSSTPTVSNEITLGNSSITTLRCQASTITSLSDARDKTNITPLAVGMDFIEKLNPVSFAWNMRDGSRIGDVDFGFIAQDLQKAQTEYGTTVPNLVYEMNPDRIEASYAALIPVMVKAIQDLNALVKQQQGEIDMLKKNSAIIS